MEEERLIFVRLDELLESSIEALGEHMGVKVWAVIHLVCWCCLKRSRMERRGIFFFQLVWMPMEISPGMFIQASSQVLHDIFSYAEYWLKLA